MECIGLSNQSQKRADKEIFPHFRPRFRGPEIMSRIATVPDMAQLLRRSIGNVARPLASAVQRTVSVRSFHTTMPARVTYEEWIQSSAPSYHQTIQKKWYPRSANGTVSNSIRHICTFVVANTLFYTSGGMSLADMLSSVGCGNKTFMSEGSAS